MSDLINSPAHYTAHASGIEAIEICQSLDFCLGNAVKYIFRAGLKDPVLQDLHKAAWYLRRAHENGNGWCSAFPDQEAVLKVIDHEIRGSVLRDVLEATVLRLLTARPALFDLALARVEREIERVQEGR